MAQSIRLDTVRKEFTTLGKTHVAVDDISLEIPAGSFTTLVGPSGCGKTTTLRMLAGLETPTAGRIHFGDDDVTDLPPQKRNVSMVFQSIALYPHMSVRENIGYGLKIHGVPKGKRDEKIEEAARVLQIEEQLEKMPAELSGGQQQRVALGGAFVQDPEVLLLDEPMSDLDAKLKSELRVEIQRLHQELDTTIVYVTHDQTEAMTMSDRVVLLREGHVAQFDPPRTLFHRPQSEYVASFIGTPSTNLLRCSVTDADGTATVEGHGIRVPVGSQLDAHLGNTVTLGIRPQYLSPSAGDIRFTVTAEVVEPLGTESVVHGKTTDGTRVDVVSPEVDDVQPGDELTVGFDREDCYIFGADGETICFGDDLAANQTQVP
ncbi:ABC transporter ATP-binding protein [Haladaptatus sp. CMSO5]|uniref:ABC transporter ATP-binding protein n=1 Tax=Haladaptatus sp. CMSO5 TaxID=3120514 RepID=UPI002FCE459B